MMQKIFSQEIRFKDENGNDYPDWVEKELGEVVEFKKGSSISKSNINISGENKCILYGELFTKYKEIIYSVKSKTNKKLEGIGQKFDILMPTSDVTPNGLARASCLLENNIILSGDMNILRPLKKLNGCYFSYQLNYENKKIMERVSGTTVKHIYVKDIKNLLYNIPDDLQEQEKIANILSALDSKIEILEKELSNSKEFKKGLLQSMFV